MAAVLKADPGVGGIAPTVSGKDSRSDSGWGNTGSLVTTGTKVSRGKN